MRYRILRPSDLVRYGDERWDFKFGWTKVKDEHLERFSRGYRRAGRDAWRFRRPLTTLLAGSVNAVLKATSTTEHEQQRSTEQ